jgi:hypothetical protein
MTANYSSVDAYLNWMRTFGESEMGSIAVSKSLNNAILEITSPSKKRFYLKQSNPAHPKAELYSRYDNSIEIINRLNALRQKNTSLLNFLLQLYLVGSETQQIDFDQTFHLIAFRQMVIFNIFAAVICYLRLITVLLELYDADEVERKVILQQRQLALLTDVLAVSAHTLRLVYMAMQNYKALPILGIVIFAIDAFVAFYELFNIYQEHQQSVIDTAKNITGFDCDDYFSMNCKTHMTYLKQEFENCEDNQKKVYLLNLIIIEQRFQLDFWKKVVNLLLCALILVAFIFLQHYLLFSISGGAVSQEFIQCVNAFIIYFCYFMRDMVLEHVIPEVLATDAVELSHAGQTIHLRHGEVIKDNHDNKETNLLESYLSSEIFLNMLIIGCGLGLLSLKLDLMVVFVILPFLIVIKEIMKPKNQENEIDVLDVAGP